MAIANKAKGKAFDVMTWVFGALMVSFALMGIDMVAVLLLVLHTFLFTALPSTIALSLIKKCN